MKDLLSGTGHSSCIALRRNSTPLASAIEALEPRVVLATVFVVPPWHPTDATHVYSLANAVGLAGAGGTVIIEPGTIPDVTPLSVGFDDITIQGEPGIAPGSLSVYDLSINADRVTLTNLNLGTVTLTPTADHVTVSNSKLFSFTETGAVSGAGGNILRHNDISGSISLGGNSGAAELTADLVEHNKFSSLSPIVISLTNSNGTVVQFNHIADAANSAVGIQVRSNSDNVSLIGNTVQLSGAGQPIAAFLLNTGGAAGNLLSAKVLNNVLSAGANGIGLYINIFGTGAGMIAQVEGNELSGNKIGVDVNGINLPTGAGNIDLGGGANTFGTSKGANNFRGFTGVNGNFAINLHNTDANAVVVAQKNIFRNEVTPGSVNRDKDNGGGTGTIDATGALDANHAYVQSLFTQLLGRVADPATGGELDLTVGKLAKLKRIGVAKSILLGVESRGLMVNDLFGQYIDRSPTDLEMIRFSKILKTGNLAAAEATIIGTAEYASRINSDFVQGVYHDLLDRSGTIAEVSARDRTLQTSGLKGVASSVAKSVERRSDYVADLYSDLLHRSGTEEEVTAAARKPGNLLKLKLNLLSSDGFFNNG